MQKILVSGCLLGNATRYDGKSKPCFHPQLARWREAGQLLVICPEVDGGLPIPRPPAEQYQDRVITQTGIDVTEAYHRGAERALALAKQHNIAYALLKATSPSCGNQRIYDGSFTRTTIQGQGVTAKLLMQNKIKVFNEMQIEDLIQCLNVAK